MKTISNTCRIIGIVIFVIGFIHQSATPMIMKNIPAEIKNIFLFMFLGTGFAFIYFGIVLIGEGKKIRNNENTTLWLTYSTFLLIVGLGIMAVWFIRNNPFAWLTLFAGIAGLTIILIKTRFSFHLPKSLYHGQ